VRFEEVREEECQKRGVVMRGELAESEPIVACRCVLINVINRWFVTVIRYHARLLIRTTDAPRHADIEHTTIAEVTLIYSRCRCHGVIPLTITPPPPTSPHTRCRRYDTNI